MNFREYFSGTLFLLLLLWGPIDHSWPSWLAIRIGYLIFIPLIIWFIIGWAWDYWQPSDKLETTLERILSGAICIALFTFAGIEGTSKNHIGNTQWIQTRDGLEAVGDDIILPGPDWGNFLVFIIIALAILWFGVLKMHKKKSNS